MHLQKTARTAREQLSKDIAEWSPEKEVEQEEQAVLEEERRAKDAEEAAATAEEAAEATPKGEMEADASTEVASTDGVEVKKEEEDATKEEEVEPEVEADASLPKPVLEGLLGLDTTIQVHCAQCTLDIFLVLTSFPFDTTLG